MGSRSKSPKVTVTPDRVSEHLRDQVNFLQKSAREYDGGDRSEFRRLAVALRVLVHHNPPNSISLLEQSALAGVKIVSSMPVVNWSVVRFNSALAAFVTGPNGMEPQPKYDGGSDRRLLNLEDWLNETVIQDAHGHQFSRWYMIRSVANQDGGAHVDPTLDEAYHRLVNEYSWGLTAIGPGGSRPIGGVERVFIRQMAWEMLESFREIDPGILPQPKLSPFAQTGLSYGSFDPNNPPW